jgi:hypothetical protein
MRAIHAVIQDGNLVLDRPLDARGRFEAVVVVLEPKPWEAVIYDPDACPEPARASREAFEEFSDRRAALAEVAVLS